MHRLWLYYSIFILTAADVILTYVGLEKGIIHEANPIMNFFLGRWPLTTVLGVMVVTGVILYFFYLVRARVKWLMQALVFLLAFKAFVILLHSCWIIMPRFIVS